MALIDVAAYDVRSTLGDTALAARAIWYGRRLRTMGSREVLWRATRVLLPAQAKRINIDLAMSCRTTQDWEDALAKFRLGAEGPSLLNVAGADHITRNHPIYAGKVIELADVATTRSFQFFGYPRVTLGQPIDWHSDPLAGIRWPVIPSTRINHRVAVADVKWIWELNRLQHLPWLAEARLLTGDERYGATAFEHIDSWIDQNPPGHGIAWRGAFEAGIRAISLGVALQGLRTSPHLTAERFRQTVDVLAQSASFCLHERSRFSSANNHLIGEMAGLAVVAILFPQLSESSDWEQRALNILSTEAQKQILPDGSGAEQAIGYQVFTAELLHIVAALINTRDGAPPPIIAKALSRSSAYLAAIVGRSDPAPRYGDDDEGFALRLGPSGVRTVRHHLGIVGAFDWGTDAAFAAEDSVDAQWFQSMAQGNRPNPAASKVAPAAEPGNHFFEDGGLVVLRSQNRRITMDVGPLGYLSIAAHGHADALAVTISEGRNDLIGDPGTGSYYGHPAWRASMRSARAHATVTVDGSDQSVTGGPFMWSRHARTRRTTVDLSAGFAAAEHDGYLRLRGRIVHRRFLIAPPTERIQLVIDLVSGWGTHEVQTTWPLHPSLAVKLNDNQHTAYRSGSSVMQILHAATSDLTIDDVRGDQQRHFGWWSNRLESRVAASWLSATCNATVPLAIATLISPMDGIATTDLSLELQEDHIHARWMEEGCHRVATVSISASALIAFGPAKGGILTDDINSERFRRQQGAD